MEEYTAISHYLYEGRPEKEAIDHLIEKLLINNNIIDVNTNEDSISIEYYQQLTSSESLLLLIEDSGIKLSHREVEKEQVYEKNPIKRFLNRMAESNEKNFGNKRLDCCDLHNSKD